MKIKSIYLKFAVALVTVLLVHNRWTVPRVSYDQMRQLVALKNFVNGDEITFGFIDHESDQVVVRNGEFPTGYYFVMAPFTVLTSDLLLLHRLVEILGMLLLIWQLFLLGNWIGRKISVPLFGYYVLLFSLVQLNPWRASGFTDIWSLLFFISAIRIALSRPTSIKSSFLVGVLSFMTSWMRYAYYPLAFVAPIILLIKHRKLSLQSSLSALTTTGLIVTMNLLHDRYFRNQTHVESHFNEERFFWSHLKQLDPLPFNALFSDHVIMNSLGFNRWGENTDWSVKYLILAIAFCILALLTFGAYKLLSQRLGNINFTLLRFTRSNLGLLFLCTFLTLLFNWGSISGLSIYYPTFKENMIYTWSLVSRYFAPSYILLQFSLSLLIFSLSKSNLRKGLLLLLTLSFLFQIAYWTSFISRFSPTDTWANYEQFYGRIEMKEVMQSIHSPEIIPDTIPSSQLSFDYLSIYYLYDSTKLTRHLKKDYPTYLQGSSN
jgi:hypothetical protein